MQLATTQEAVSRTARGRDMPNVLWRFVFPASSTGVRQPLAHPIIHMASEL